MIYSKWKPATGGYDYFFANEYDIPLGNDLPHPDLPRGTDIGVASVEIGRPIPAGAVRAGSGAEAKGMVAAVVSSKGPFGELGAITEIFPIQYLFAAGGILVGWFLCRKK